MKKGQGPAAENDAPHSFLVAPLAAARCDSSSHVSVRDKKTSGGTQIDSSHDSPIEVRPDTARYSS